MGEYDRDFHAWAHTQADAARRRAVNEIDWENLAEELRSLGSQVEWELFNRYRVLILHLLKWAYQPKGHGRSWRATIAEQRRQIARLLMKNPSLRSVESQEFADAYVDGRKGAIDETDLADAAFPVDPPFTLEQAKSDDFWPE